MSELKSVAPYLIGGILGYLLKDIPLVQTYGPWGMPVIYVLVIVLYLVSKVIRIRRRTLIASRYDHWIQLATLFSGILLLIVFSQNDILLVIGNGLIPFLGLFLIISGSFYERSIQLEHKDNQLIIEYKNKAKTHLDHLDSYEYHENENTVEIKSGDRIIVIYNVIMRGENLKKLSTVLGQFKRS
jgi:hypothetical protein